MRESKLLERWLVRMARLGFTDSYHDRVQKRGIAGQIYLLLFGTPHLGSFANGFYLRRILTRYPFNSILDAGCGDGTFSFYVAANRPESQILGIDIGEQGLHGVENTLQICARIQGILNFKNLVFRQVDLRELEFQEEFDFIYCFDVLEHIPENKQVLKRFHGALKRGGMLLIRIPTRLQKRILPASFTSEHEKWAAIEHVGQHYDVQSLSNDLRELGYSIVSLEYTMGFWGRLSFELDEGMRTHHIPESVRFAVIPFLKIFRSIDIFSRPKDGDGLLVLCQK